MRGDERRGEERSKEAGGRSLTFTDLSSGAFFELGDFGRYLFEKERERRREGEEEGRGDEEKEEGRREESGGEEKRGRRSLTFTDLSSGALEGIFQTRRRRGGRRQEGGGGGEEKEGRRRRKAFIWLTNLAFLLK